MAACGCLPGLHVLDSIEANIHTEPVVTPNDSVVI